ncbi:hypothetical protein AR457_06045 [Streptomyces agglomeratus]|uniref:Berberine/berberine-like domain-containing protein n=1 Tax=Streptomyces agglomeratus TaxID=285458 RepID=A0A1E5P430_9ACTN|nr:BBE domain-containing protein [Streptomyces agglomeratus]OEJ24094.1 hypothetical protein AS594_05975 [Streptomyces agglomeratus]OEJ41902.1 hypothetical protein BGK70_30600 [Streptomyces agglomeratus]OEJ43720.1 hypothetical protein AR457_06045 [Streptomyces agglomeratus]OEJ54394.1 hypothetical protein BGK72_29915 [Streptomyces agglomeratus]OEJ61762.1 hypothetical protein BGM19_30815 [Streptomyces agglomeratus]
MTKGFTEHQIEAIHRHLTDAEYKNPEAVLQVDSYGGAVNDVRSEETAVPQRSSVMKLQYQTYWTWGTDADKNGFFDYRDAEKDPEIAGPHLRWIRNFYQDVYKPTGGVPAVVDPAFPATKDANTDGCYINYPDVDISDPTLNTLGQPWHQLYYKNSYQRLQRAKKLWDPHNVFRHEQSVAVPAAK